MLLVKGQGYSNMEIIIEQSVADLMQHIENRQVINIEEINSENIAALLEAQSLAVIGSGSDKAKLVEQMVNSRPNDARPITLVQKHPDLLVLVDKEGAASIYE